MSRIDSETLCAVAGVERATLDTWIHRDVIVPPKERRGRAHLWDVAEAMTVALFAAVLRENRSVADAAAEARGMMAGLGRLVEMAVRQPDQVAGARRIVFVSAVLPDGERIDRMVLSDQDLQTLLNVCARKGAVSLMLRDVSETYAKVLLAIHEARHGDRAAEIARATAELGEVERTARPC